MFGGTKSNVLTCDPGNRHTAELRVREPDEKGAILLLVQVLLRLLTRDEAQHGTKEEKQVMLGHRCFKCE